ncbi:hypothetical protein M408DRAFT_24855 [Serendipita vermifera MAFF 305830]|uniref:Uncharacterized protein n=1 Tax=Serendipita vermifera MAFF 305830 TaxID=933852 RepID=A0A0C3B6P9_SERVB|nr:hypothetical protein M408DRAFT_30586 [Serendipita vermifera MAFF 305830]KIM27111.1 hypothetical protein M408DRAFT_24855 [Serendipita vermifera MAFF 305830]
MHLASYLITLVAVTSTLALPVTHRPVNGPALSLPEDHGHAAPHHHATLDLTSHKEESDEVATEDSIAHPHHRLHARSMHQPKQVMVKGDTGKKATAPAKPPASQNPHRRLLSRRQLTLKTAMRKACNKHPDSRFCRKSHRLRARGVQKQEVAKGDVGKKATAPTKPPASQNSHRRLHARGVQRQEVAKGDHGKKAATPAKPPASQNPPRRLHTRGMEKPKQVMTKGDVGKKAAAPAKPPASQNPHRRIHRRGMEKPKQVMAKGAVGKKAAAPAKPPAPQTPHRRIHRRGTDYRKQQQVPTKADLGKKAVAPAKPPAAQKKIHPK